MRVIPVLDVLRGRAVHARAGNRASYAPLTSQLAPGMPGDAPAIARALHDRLGLRELYVADLDAITGRAPQRELRRAIATGLPNVALWVDAGSATPDQVREVAEDGAARVIVGLETLPPSGDPRAVLGSLAVAIRLTGPRISGQSNTAPPQAGQSNTARPQAGQPDASTTESGQSNTPSEGVGRAGGQRAVFSLDLRAGQPNAAGPALRSLAPLAIAELAASSGFGTIIILDLARVGMATGPDLALLREIRGALPHIELVTGGGIRDARDLERLADAGADAALVGSALHHGSAGHGSILWACGTLTSDVTSPPADA